LKLIPGSNRLTDWPNPVGIDRVLTLIQSWKADFPASHHSISLTGGEPLLHAETLLQWLPRLRNELPIYLETNGTLPDQLESLISYADWIAMDIKIHSLSGERTDWDVHRRFLEIANRTHCYVKVVVGEKTPDLELQLAGDLVATVSKKIPLVLQPVTRKGRVAVSTQKLLHMQAVISESHDNIRIIPQTHVFLDLM
jgi:7-carboxy-7-deazaguanine synthase